MVTALLLALQGNGLTLTLVAAEKVDAVLRFIWALRQEAWQIGELVKGTGAARVVF